MTRRIFGIEHQPLIASVQRNRNNPSKVIAFIENKVCFFEQNTTLPAPDDQVEVMITGVVCGTYPPGHEHAGAIDPTIIRALMIQVVDPERHMLVAIEGFYADDANSDIRTEGYETDGAKPFVTPDDDPTYFGDTMLFAPGRTGCLFDEGEVAGRHSTNVYVDRIPKKMNHDGSQTIAGLTRMSDGIWAQYIGNTVEPTHRKEKPSGARPQRSRPSAPATQTSSPVTTTMVVERVEPPMPESEYKAGDVITYTSKRQTVRQEEVSTKPVEAQNINKTRVGTFGDMLSAALKK